MSAYNFHKRFERAILDGTKIGTVRARRKNGYLPKVNDVIRLYVGMRTTGCRLLKEVVVRDVQPITINVSDDQPTEVILGSHRFSAAEIAAFARAEGFESLSDFEAFFYGGQSGLYHIRWKDG